MDKREKIKTMCKAKWENLQEATEELGSAMNDREDMTGKFDKAIEMYEMAFKEWHECLESFGY